MTATTIVVMLAVLGFVWGGLALILFTAASRERQKRAVEASGS